MSATRKPWSVALPIRCQADLDEAHETLARMREVVKWTPPGSPMRTHMELRVHKLSRVIAQYEDNLI